jgi:hypothetical protein
VASPGCLQQSNKQKKQGKGKDKRPRHKTRQEVVKEIGEGAAYELEAPCEKRAMLRVVNEKRMARGREGQFVKSALAFVAHEFKVCSGRGKGEAGGRKGKGHAWPVGGRTATPEPAGGLTFLCRQLLTVDYS